MDSLDANSWVDTALQSQHIAVAVISLFENRYVRANEAMADVEALHPAFGIDAWEALRIAGKNGGSEVRRKRVQVRALPPVSASCSRIPSSPACRLHSWRRAYSRVFAEAPRRS